MSFIYSPYYRSNWSCWHYTSIYIGVIIMEWQEILNETIISVIGLIVSALGALLIK
jgi:hypothetical protein